MTSVSVMNAILSDDTENWILHYINVEKHIYNCEKSLFCFNEGSVPAKFAEMRFGKFSRSLL